MSDYNSDYSDDELVAGYMQYTDEDAVDNDSTITISMTFKFNNTSDKATPKDFEINWIAEWGKDCIVEQMLDDYMTDLISSTWDKNRVTMVINKGNYNAKKILSDIEETVYIGNVDDMYTESFWVVHQYGLDEMAKKEE
jgi:hypothetical protein